MKIGRFIVAVLSVTVLSTIVNTVYYAATAQAHTWDATRSEPLIGLMVLNHIVFAVLLTVLYPMMRRRTTARRDGFTFGVLMGLVMFVPTGLVVRAAWTVPITIFFIVDTLFHALLTGGLGMVVAAFHAPRTAAPA